MLKDGSVQNMGRRGEAEQQEVQAELGTHKMARSGTQAMLI